MNKELKQIIKKLSGSVVLLGILDEEVVKEVDRNKNINNSLKIDEGKKKYTKEEKKKGFKNFQFGKLKKTLKNKVDYIICDVNGINMYLNKFINMSYDLLNKQIIFYGVFNEYDVDRVIKKYERYNCSCKKLIFGDSFILIVDMDNIKITKVKRFFNRILDVFKDFYEALGNGLMQ